MPGKRINDDLHQEIIVLFSTLGNCKTVAEKLNISAGSVVNHLRREGIKCGGKAFSQSCRINKSNHKRYAEIWPLKDDILGYVCGLIASDGSLLKAKKQIFLQLHKRDWLLVDNFIDFLVYPRPDVMISKNSARAALTLPKLYQYCLDMGITPNKSLTLDVKLDDKSDEFKRYFLRGVIDGDGCISKDRIRILTGSLAFVKTINSVYGGRHRINSYSPISGNPVYCNCFQSKSLDTLLRTTPIESYMLQRKNSSLLLIKEQRLKDE